MKYTTPPFQDSSKLSLTDLDFEKISKIAKVGWGLNLDSSKKPLIGSRLSRRVKHLGLVDFASYCKRVESGDEKEIEHFISALTTNVTQFYREVHHFDHLEAEVLPILIERAKSGERIRIWSAGCSSGQEPYSLAASILNYDQSALKYDLKILATDIDLDVLQKATQGRYKSSECKFPSKAYQKRVFNTEKSEVEFCEVRQNLRQMISFRYLNLVQDWPIGGKFDVIFCRNVVIYFDRETQSRLWQRFSNLLVTGGKLYIGHSERIVDPISSGLEVCGTTTYCRSS